MNFGATVTRVNLGLADLNINDHVNFYVAPGIMGATVQWRRKAIQSPYVESQFTVNRVRDIVEDAFPIEVLGSTQTILQDNIKTLIDAFSQDWFNVSLDMDEVSYTWACEASDYSLDATHPRFHAPQVQVKFNLRRSPVPINGPF